MARLTSLRFAWLLLPLVVGSCTDTPRLEAVPNNAMRKSDLAGDWVSSTTAISVPANTGWSFEGAVDWINQPKLRWEVQENLLVGYQSFETAAGVNTDVDAEPPKTGYVPPGTRCFEQPARRNSRAFPIARPKSVDTPESPTSSVATPRVPTSPAFPIEVASSPSTRSSDTSTNEA